MSFNYQQICQGLFQGVSDRTKDVLERRYGLRNAERETLEAVGKIYGVTRERVRQLEMDGLLRLRPKLSQCQPVIRYLTDILEKSGSIKKEETLFEAAGPSQFRGHISFLLTLGEQFERNGETDEFYPFWYLDRSLVDFARSIIDGLTLELEKSGRLLSDREMVAASIKLISSVGGKQKPSSNSLFSYLEASKKIKRGPAGLFGLDSWPEVSPRGVKDKAYVVFKQARRPLHFTEVASQIDELERNARGATIARTVHNELIKDQRFVLVGRGTYALREWGYQDGDVSDVVLAVLKTSGIPLAKQEVLDRVLQQRLVKPSTILLNLNNNRHIHKDSQGRYLFEA